MTNPDDGVPEGVTIVNNFFFGHDIPANIDMMGQMVHVNPEQAGIQEEVYIEDIPVSEVNPEIEFWNMLKDQPYHVEILHDDNPLDKPTDEDDYTFLDTVHRIGKPMFVFMAYDYVGSAGLANFLSEDRDGVNVFTYERQYDVNTMLHLMADAYNEIQQAPPNFEFKHNPGSPLTLSISDLQSDERSPVEMGTLIARLEDVLTDYGFSISAVFSPNSTL